LAVELTSGTAITAPAMWPDWPDCTLPGSVAAGRHPGSRRRCRDRDGGVDPSRQCVLTYGPNDLATNEAFTRLGVDMRVTQWRVALVVRVAKYTWTVLMPAPGSLQSLHDNLLGNLGSGALTQRYGVTALHDAGGADPVGRSGSAGPALPAGTRAMAARRGDSGYRPRRDDGDRRWRRPMSTTMRYRLVGRRQRRLWHVRDRCGTGQWTHTLDDTRPATRRWRRAMRRPRPSSRR
jgi:hypothetical protein